jgi:hypothetical protein
MVKKAVPKPANLLADKLLRVLAAQRALGPDSYPLTARRLVELTDPQAPAAVVKLALNKKVFTQGAVLVRAKTLDAPVALAEDLAGLAASPLALEFLLRAAATAKTRALSPAALKEKASGKVKKPFQDALNRHATECTLPPTVGWVLVRGGRLFFLLSDLHTSRLASPGPEGEPAPPATPGPAGREAPAPAEAAGTPDAFPPAEFEADFDSAFGHLDREAGGHNFVSLVALRRALPLPRGVFDAGLQQLRRAGRYALSAAEGRHGITPEEREAALPEEGSLLLFVSRSPP